MIGMVKKILLAFIVTSIFWGTAFAAHPLITDDTGTQGKGKFQLEVNGEIGNDRETFDGIESKEHAGELAAAFSAGVTDDVDIVVGFPWAWVRSKEDSAVVSDGNGPGDVSLEAKWRFFQKGGFSLALKPGMTIPTGNEDRGLGNGRISYGAALIASQEWERFFVYANAAYTHNEFKLDADRETNRADIWHASVAAGVDVVKNLTLVANTGMETNSDRGSDTWPAFILGGAIYSVTENFDVDLGIKVGLNDPETDLAALAGIAWRF
jgi:hypothetical protein